MRKIKFRYWNDVTKQMVNDPPMPHKENWTIEQLFSDRGWVWMQFTGLLDKSGKEIYEGDVVRFKEDSVDTTGQVVWGINGFDIDGGDGFYSWGEQMFSWDELEIIGNIYENPDLCK